MFRIASITPLLSICLVFGCSEPKEPNPPIEPTSSSGAAPAQGTHALRVTSLDGEREIPITEAERIRIESEEYVVEAIRSWSGLLRDPAGGAMASISIRTDADVWEEDVLVASGAWIRFADAPPIRFDFDRESEDPAAALTTLASAAPPGRWGVREGARTSWFTSFTPGTGLELTSGTTVLLIEASVEGEPFSIDILLEQNGERERRKISMGDDDPLVVLEMNPFRSRALALWSDRIDHAELFEVYGGTVQSLGSIRSGATLTDPVSALTIRLEQVLPNAVPVLREDSPLLEAVLSGPEGRIRVRQGEAVRVGEATLRFVRNPAVL